MSPSLSTQPQPPTDNETVAPRRVLPAIVLAQLAGTSPWFAVNAVMPDLQQTYGWTAAALATLSSSLQLGFIAGTLVFALLAIADRWPARKVFALCALAAAACTVAAALSAASLDALLAWRVATGFFLAGIYPVGMKLAALWFPRGLGAALGWLVGALVLGSASPHALRALGAEWAWQSVFFSVAAVTAAAGLLVLVLVPEPVRQVTQRPTQPSPQRPPAALRFSALPSLWCEAQVRASVLGYFGHMWELYALWVLMPLILATRLSGAVAVSAWSFATLGAGVVGCVAGGVLAMRLGSASVARTQLAVSALCCLVSPWMLSAPLPLFLAWLVLWGVTVVGDSPQFSALTAANAPRDSVGSVLTLTNSLGFAISAVSIELFVRLSQTVPLPQLLPWLAAGPVLGLLAMRPLFRR